MRKILIVDDEEKIRELIRMNLELAGYKCDEAEDGEIALEKLNKFSPDLALLDIMLPKRMDMKLHKVLLNKMSQ